MNGITQGARTSIFAHRPAPVQVNYLVYPGTIGALYIDYIIGDRTLFTSANATAYSEKLVQLPHSYQPNDRKPYIFLKRSSTDEILDFRSDNFVFCCFNNNFKILPNTFDCWMHTLKRVDGSVL